MTLTQCLKACTDAGAFEAYCTRLSPTWLVLHVDLGDDARADLARRLRPILGYTDDPRHSKRSVTVGFAEPEGGN